jgi:hypothetical protein
MPKWRRYSACVALVFGALILTGTTMSSIGIGQLRADGRSEGAGMIGTPRSIRSDEFLRTSVWRIGALEDRDMSFGTPLGSDGEFLTAMVTRGVVGRVVLFESLLADLGRFVPDQIAFALLWWAPSLLFWLFAPRLFFWFGMTPVLAVLTAAVMYLSPAVMWWSLGTINSGLATSIVAALLLLYAARTVAPSMSRGALVRAGAAAVGAGVLIARIPFSYAPWALPSSAGVLVPAVFVAVSRFGWRTTMKVLAVAGVTAIAGIVAVILEHKAGFDSLRATVYPGSRRSTGQALDLGYLFGAPHLGVLKTTDQFLATNASEISSALTVLAVPCVLYGFASVDHWRERLSAAWWGHAAAFVVFFAWVSIDIPARLGERLPGLSLTTPGRTAQVVGFIATAWFGVTVASMRKAPSETRIRVGAATAVVVFVVVALSGSVLRVQHIPDLRVAHVLVNAAVVALGVGIALAVSKTPWAMAPLAAFVLVMAVGTNPVIHGLGDLRTSASARTVQRLDRELPGRWVTDSPNLDGLLMANAVPSLSGEQWTGPDAAAWRRLDPASAFEEAWNRGAAIVAFDFDPAQSGLQMTSPSPDVVKVVVNPCDPKLAAMDVRVVVSTHPLDAPCLTPHGQLPWSGLTEFVYELRGSG